MRVVANMIVQGVFVLDPAERERFIPAGDRPKPQSAEIVIYEVASATKLL